MNKSKKLFARALYLVFALALVAGLTLAPAVAANVSQPMVSITADKDVISTVGEYTIGFTISVELILDTDSISVRFPDDTTVPESFADADITLAGTSGIGSDAFTVENVGDDATSTPTDGTVEIALTLATLDAAVGSGNPVGALADLQLVFTTGGAGEIINPTEVGDYTLEVKTSVETTWVESTTYTIVAPVLGGTVYVYNPSDVLMDIYSGAEALNHANAGTYYGDADYIIEVGPGTYTLGDTIDITGEGLTFESTDGAASTIIDASGLTGGWPATAGIYIDAADVTVDGFTVVDAPACGIYLYDADDAIIQNNVVTFDSSVVIGIDVSWLATGVMVSGNEFNENATMFVHGSDCTLSGNTFGECVNVNPEEDQILEGLTITDNTMIGSACMAIDFFAGTGTFDDILIEGNTISENEGSGIEIKSGLTITNLVITGNDITDNEGVGLLVESWNATDAIKFNNITGNDITNGYGIETDVGTAVDATHNWWGSADEDDVAAMVYDNDELTVYDPFLTDTVDAVFSATAVDTAANSLDAETEVGVEVLGTGYTTNPYVVSAAKYIANPGGPLDNALAFYDVYVTGQTTASTDTVMLHFYAGDDDALLYAWSANTDTWVEVIPEADFSEFGGYLHVTLTPSDAETPSTPTIADLTELPFAVCGEAAVTKGDFDGDGDIDIVDFVQFATAYGSELGDDNYNAIGDFDDDGEIDILDFVQFAGVYGA